MTAVVLRFPRRARPVAAVLRDMSSPPDAIEIEGAVLTIVEAIQRGSLDPIGARSIVDEILTHAFNVERFGARKD